MAENEELDIFKNRKWRPFINTLRGAPSLHDEDVLRVFDRCFVPSLRRAFRLLKVKALISACIVGDTAAIESIRHDHRRQRDRAETFADLVLKVCRPGMTYREAVDAFLHGACARVIDQAALQAVPSDNFPTIEDYRQASAIWLFRMEGRIGQLVERVIADPAKLKVQRESPQAKKMRLDQQLRWSLREPRPHSGDEGQDHDGEISDSY